MLSGFHQKNTTCTHHCHQPHIKKKGAPRKIQRFQNQVSLGRIQTFLRFCALIPRREENHQDIPNPSCLFIASGQDRCRDRVTGLKISAISYDGHCTNSKLALFLIMSVLCMIRRIKFSPRPTSSSGPPLLRPFSPPRPRAAETTRRSLARIIQQW